jgi:SMODS domain-containing protein
MSKLESQFNDFLSNIEPDSKAVKYAKKAHEPLREYLSKDEEFGEHFVDSFLYGSYKRHTAVGDIKDVDIVILTNFSEENKPNDVLKKLKSALARYYKDPENPEYQRRSIRVNDPLPDSDIEMTLDVIPAILITDDESPLKVPDREAGKWVWTNPKGHIKYTSDLNKDNVSNGRFVPLVKIFKWWWRYQCEENQPDVERPKPKGFWLECLTGENFDMAKNSYADHFGALLHNVYIKYKDVKNVPELCDPGLKNEKIETTMTKAEFLKFMKILKNSLDLAVAAINMEDDSESSEEWRKVFGPKFPLVRKSSNSSSTKREGPVITRKPDPWLKR